MVRHTGESHMRFLPFEVQGVGYVLRLSHDVTPEVCFSVSTGGYERVGKGASFALEVLKTVQSLLVSLIREGKVKKFSWISDDPTLEKVYQLLLRKNKAYLKTMGWAVGPNYIWKK